MSHWGQIVGLPPLEEAEAKKQGERISEGHRRSRNYRQTRRLEYMVTKARAYLNGESMYAARFRGHEGRYNHRRNKYKHRFRKALNKMAYLKWGILEPRPGKGHKSKQHDEWECMMNFIAQGWNPSTGLVSEEVPPGRWDLEPEDWSNLWRGWTEEMASGYGVFRLDTGGHFDPNNVTLASRESKRFT